MRCSRSAAVNALSDPPSQCEMCRRYEQSYWKNLREDLRKVRSYLTPNAAEMMHDAMQGNRALINAMLGDSSAIDWWETNPYAMHRKLYEQTGDSLELMRMLRHVKAGDSG